MNAQREARQTSAVGFERVDFRLLGPLEALVAGKPVELGAPKQRALLVHLLLRANEAVPVERLVDALWPDDPPASARHAIQVYVSRLRRVLGVPGRIEARSRAYSLRAAAEEIDLSRFRQLVGEAHEALAREDASSAGERLRDALALWRGGALADLDDEPGLSKLALELEEERVGAIELRVESELEAGRSAELVPELEQLVAEYPAREQFHAQLMLALHRAGRQTDALEAYQRARRSLLNELGLDPSRRLQELEAAILRRDPALTPEAPDIAARRHVPAQPNEFIGREQQLEEVVELITNPEPRLVTLTGTGGVGKTRLALAAAERLAADFEDGVWFVDLSALSDPSLVVSALAQALGVRKSPDQPVHAALEGHLAEKQLLLVVDNFEQVGDAAPLLSRLIRRAPRLTILVTSRSPLHVFAEREYNVPPLAVPDPNRGDALSVLAEVEAVRLLVTRARAVARRFELTEANARQIAEICAALDGLPLAIELAGATLKQFSPSELRDRLETSLDLLVVGPVDAPARQQTVRATIEWSHSLLATAEQQLFARLAVFRGGWTAEAARDVGGVTERSLNSLREKSLIYADGQRFTMLIPIREFALDQLEPREARLLAQKHAEFFTRLAESAEAHALASGRTTKILEDFGRDYENFRAALRSTHDAGETELFARLAAALGQYWISRGPYAEARQWLEVAFNTALDDTSLDGRVARSLGMVCVSQGDYERAKTAYEQALQLFRSNGDRDMESRCLMNLGGAALALGDYGRARRLLTQSRQLARELGSELMLARIANLLGVLELMQERLAEAEPWFEESLTAFERAGDREGACVALLNLGLIALRADRLEDAASRLREGLGLAEELQHSLQMANCVQGLAAVAAQLGNLGRAGRLLGIAHAFLEVSGAAHEPFLSALRDETRAAVRAASGDDVAAEAFEVGRSQRASDALAYAAKEDD